MRDDERLTCKPDMVAEWENTVAHNQDAYGHLCIVAASKVGAALDEGKTPEESRDEMFGIGLSGYMAGCVAHMISCMHVRGEEFRLWWNETVQSGAETAGVLNPALMTIDCEGTES